jgi:glycosyltransferase involved in cell wall biosynthesis
MVEALPRLANLFPNLRYVVVGQAGGLWQSYWEVLQEQVRRTEVEERVLFLGHISDDQLRDAYAAADVVVLPSYAETFPLAVLDAMAWGKPIVAARVGGIEHMLTDGRTGILIEPRNSDALALAIKRLLMDADLSASMGAKARSDVHDRFSWAEVIGRYEEICQRLVKSV